MNNLLHFARRQWLIALLTLAGGCWQVTQAQNIVECFWNNDLRLGVPTCVVVSPNEDIQFDIPMKDVPYGLNVLGLRAIVKGIPSSTLLRKIYKTHVASDEPANYVEYFVDRDPGVGKAQREAVEPDEDGNVVMDISDVHFHQGLNNLGLRLVADYGNRQSASPVTFRHVYNYPAPNQIVSGIEYFINTDPGIGKAKQLRWPQPLNTPGGERNEPVIEPLIEPVPKNEAPRRQASSTVNVSFDIDVEELRTGVNVLGLRTIGRMNRHDTYSPTTYRYVYLPPSDQPQNIDYVEYFWDTDPGLGKGIPMDITPGTLVELQDYEVNIANLFGKHILYVRSHAGQSWVTSSHEVELPSQPLSGVVNLDWTLPDAPEYGVYQTLASFISGLYQRGVAPGLQVDVNDGTYYCQITDQMLPMLQAVAQALETYNLYFEVKAYEAATLSFVLTEDFMARHQEELESVIVYVQSLFSHVVTTNVSLLLNDDVYKYDGFQVEPNDLLALKNFYNRLGGPEWTPKQWSFATNGRQREDFPGVTFDAKGCVTAIELPENNIKGKLGDWNLYLPKLNRLNLSNNHLSGDLAPFVAELGNLVELFVSDNELTEISYELPSSIEEFSAEQQNTKETEEGLEFVDMSALAPVLVYMSSDFELRGLPSLFTYNWMDRKRTLPSNIGVISPQGRNVQWAVLLNRSDDAESNSYGYEYLEWYLGSDYKQPQDQPAVLTCYNEGFHGSAYPAIIRWVPGDADFSGYTDVLDVQYTLSYILNNLYGSRFNYSAANTYEDDVMNVQDIVCTVNLVLANEAEEEAPALARRRARSRMALEPVRASLFAKDEKIVVASSEKVAALDVELEGVSTDEVSLLLNRQDFQMMGRNTRRGARFVIFSPTGKTLPEGCSDVLVVSKATRLVAAQLSNAQAREIRTLLNATATGLTATEMSLSAHFEGSQLIVTSGALVEGAQLRLTAMGGSLLHEAEQTLLPGDNRMDVALPAGAYLLEVVTAMGERHIVKLMKK